ncbi:MAG: hypothetical protein ACE5D6_02370 [Candidatus Zixiibacteriota bacterium]
MIELIGTEIPERYFINSAQIFYQSDSLYLNQRLLIRNKDYSFNSHRKTFDLANMNRSNNDTLLIIYSEIPSWIKTSYGRELPEITPGTVVRSEYSHQAAKDVGSTRFSNINMSGTKTFRFSSRSSGSSNFNQSLDLQLSGNLTPGLEINGTVSDRGFNPSYGTSNSRINELDKINLKLTSKTFTAQIGDVLLNQKNSYGAAGYKKMSGALFEFNESNFRLDAAAARPRGRYETFLFYGADGRQGPYQIGDGSRALPIVPGSETIWLDGSKLSRGANKDYIIDYPVGRITFNVNHPVDNRSRIEIDYEPLTTSYKGELFTTGGAVALKDSSLTVDIRWLREGDDKELLLLGNLTEQDKNILSTVGDNTFQAVRSGVRQDSLGNYIIIADSLPDSVFQYVGEKMGDYSVIFSFFGQGKGDYQFLGSGQYRYAGIGNGDYSPLIIIPAPERTDYYISNLSVHNNVLGEIKAEFQQSRFDRNLLSNLDDNDNDKIYYSFQITRSLSQKNKNNYVTFKTRKKEFKFKSRKRLYRADFNRDFLIPNNFQADADETIYDLISSASISPLIDVRPFYSQLIYKNRFRSNTGGIGIIITPNDNLNFSTRWKTIRTTLDSSSSGEKGKGDIINNSISYNKGSSLKIVTDYEYDSREHDYADNKRGTRYNQIRLAVQKNYEKIRYEYYIEDSLIIGWQRVLKRNRVTASSSRKINHLNYNALITYQWLQQTGFNENTFLSRLNIQYNNSDNLLNMGAVYALSEETRNSRGINYIEVEAGEGNYIFEDGTYVPDVDGNFIRVEEILSEQSKVGRGEKSFHFSKAWPKVSVRFNSNIVEELLPQGERTLWWIIPFLSDQNQPYQFYVRRYNSDVRLFPIAGGHVVNLNYSEDNEIRSISGSPQIRKDVQGELIIKQVVKNAYFEQMYKLFNNDRNTYYNGGGNIEGYKISLSYRQLLSSNEISVGTGYRKAESDIKEQSKTFAVIIGSRYQVIRKGELRSSLEFYRQTLGNIDGNPSFLLTDNRPGKKGAVWSLALRYGLKKGMRVNFSLSGRHSDSRTARITGKGEFIAGF